MLLAIAGYLAIALGLVHSVLGERLIFARWRKTPPDIPRQHRGIIWASWHALTLFGAVIGIILIRVPLDAPTIMIIGVVMVLAAIFVAYGTRWRHPGWIILTVIGGLVGISGLG